MPRAQTFAARFAPAAVLLFAAWFPQLGRADVIQLRNGGELRGEIDRDSIRNEDGPLRITLLSGTDVAVAREAVSLTVYRSLRIETYETRLKRSPQTVESLWELADWCARERMPDQQAECLERLVAISPNHSEARRLLGHVQFQGDWMPREEMMNRKGYVKYGRRYITRQELALLEQSQADRDAEREWLKRIRRYAAQLYSNSAPDSREAQVALQQVDDPAAVHALTAVFHDHADPAARRLMVDSLASVGSPGIVEPLTEQAIFDVDPAVRHYALISLPEKYRATAEERFAYYLRNRNNAVVRHAADALAQVGSDASLDDLVNALVTRHTKTVQVEVYDGVSFDVINQPQSGTLGTIPVELEVTLPGGGVIPYNYQVQQPVRQTAPTKTKPVQVAVDVQNEEVLAALKTLTGEDFGYNERAWRLWLTARKNNAPALPKSVPAG